MLTLTLITLVSMTVGMLLATVVIAFDLHTSALRFMNALAGATDIDTYNLNAICPEDTADYADGVYEVKAPGSTERFITWYSAVQIKNLLAFGYDIAFVVSARAY